MHNSYHTNFASEKWFLLDLKVPERIIFTHAKLVTGHEILLTTALRRAIESRHVNGAFPLWPNALTWLMQILSTIIRRLFGELLLILHHIAFTSLTMDDINQQMHFNGEMENVGLMFYSLRHSNLWDRWRNCSTTLMSHVYGLISCCRGMMCVLQSHPATNVAK